jgi:hypothetical protein
MKKIFYSLCILSFVAVGAAHAEAEIKTVCKDVTDKKGRVVTDKAGKPVQDCKKIKVHKKFDGTPVPQKK